MIDHHRGGVDMAKRQIQSGSSDKLTGLAEDMVRVQQHEIALMQRWQNTKNA
jgi:uncharacterized protein (DUF305 family)